VLDEVLPNSGPLEFRGLRRWLERALQLNGQEFLTTIDATDALREIPNESPQEHAQRWQELLKATPFFDELTPVVDEAESASVNELDAESEHPALVEAAEPLEEFPMQEPPVVSTPPTPAAGAVQPIDEPNKQAMPHKAVWSPPPLRASRSMVRKHDPRLHGTRRHP
jgi:hypothetical protein